MIHSHSDTRTECLFYFKRFAANPRKLLQSFTTETVTDCYKKCKLTEPPCTTFSFSWKDSLCFAYMAGGRLSKKVHNYYVASYRSCFDRSEICKSFITSYLFICVI